MLATFDAVLVHPVDEPVVVGPQVSGNLGDRLADRPTRCNRYPPAQRPVTTIVYVALAVKPTSGNEPVKVTSWVPDGSGVSIT